MPDYTGSIGGGANLYTDAPPAPEQPTEEPKQEKEETQEPTAEIPKALLGGREFKPGEEVMLRVVQVMEDSVLVEYAHGDEEGSGEHEAPPAPAPPGPPGGAPNPMSAMMN